MFSSILKVALRAAYRDPGGTAVNLLGLVTGFAVFIAALAFVFHEQSYDRFFANADRIVTLHTAVPEDATFSMKMFRAYVPGIVSDIRKDFPEVEAVTIFARSDHSVSVGDREFTHVVRFADTDFFGMFDLDFIAGGADAWPDRTDAALLDRSMAVKLFGTTDAVGRVITLDHAADLEIVGVYEDLPANTQFNDGHGEGPKMGIIASLPLYERLNNVDLSTYNSIGTSNAIFLLLPAAADRETLARDLTSTTLGKLSDGMRRIIGKAVIIPLADVHAQQWKDDDIPALQIALGTGTLILLIAVINTVSLNTARMIRRSREISLRRIAGAGRRDLVVQLFAESTVATALALFLALGLLALTMPWLVAKTGYAFEITPFLRGETPLGLAGVVILVAAVSISYPAILLSGLSKGFSLGRSVYMGHTAAWTRKLLAVVQFSSVTALVMLLIVVARQNSFLEAQAPDLNASRVVTIHGLTDDGVKPRLPTLAAALERIPGVDMVSRSAVTPYDGTLWMGLYQSPNDDSAEPLRMQMMIVDDRFLSLYGIGLDEGRNFDGNRSQDIRTLEDSLADKQSKEQDGGEKGTRPTEPEQIINVIINHAAASQLGLPSPAEAIGRTFRGGGTEDNTIFVIIGITPNIALNGLDSDAMPAVYLYEEINMSAFSVRFSSPADVDIGAIHAVLSELVPDQKTRVGALAETILAGMEDHRRVQDSVLAVAMVAIILAASGLYALAAFLATSKRREMGIRKVMGARTEQLVRFLLWQFSRPVVLSLLIGLPIGWHMIGTYLERFNHRFTPDIDLLLGTALITVLITGLTVISHAVRAARTRPAEVLRHE